MLPHHDNIYNKPPSPNVHYSNHQGELSDGLVQCELYATQTSIHTWKPDIAIKIEFNSKLIHFSVISNLVNTVFLHNKNTN